MKTKIFYRVANIETNQGLWYDFDGKFTGLIHHRFDFCRNTNLPMPYDTELIEWLSATEKLEELWFWFPKEDIYKLQESGWYVYAYQARKWKSYDYNDEVTHLVIDKETSIPLLRIEISNKYEIGNIEEVKRPQRVAY